MLTGIIKEGGLVNTNFMTRAVVNINVIVEIVEQIWTAIRLARAHGSFLEFLRLTTSARGDGWMEQLFKHAGVCYWGWDNYGFASEMRQLLPNGCKKTDYVANGTNLFLDVKPSVNASLSLALYTDNSCSKLYTGSGNFDVYGVVGTSKSDMGYFNYLLNGYKTCQPCIAYNLTDGDFTCKDDAGYTNCRQVSSL
jgi:hypothetical protein